MALALALHPLPEQVHPVFLDVLRDVHPDLAAPFVKASSQEALGMKLEDVTIRNVVYKLLMSGYVWCDSWYLTMDPSSSLKKWQELCVLTRPPCLFGKRVRTALLRKVNACDGDHG